MGGSKWLCLLVYICTRSFTGHAQYTTNYMDIYPRLFTFYESGYSKPDNVTLDQIQYVHPVVMDHMAHRRAYEERLIATHQVVDVERPSLSGRHMYHSAVKTQRIAETEPYESYFEFMTYELKYKMGRSYAEVAQNSEYHGPFTPSFCHPHFVYPCDGNQKYRSIDGTCNNFKNPSWGSAVSCYRRILPAAYSDGVSAIRTDHYGNRLPNPRTLTNYLHEGNPTAEAHSYTHFLAQWGQFAAHDFTLVKPYLIAGQDVLNCCPRGPYRSTPYAPYNTSGYQDDRAELHPHCFPIYMPEDEGFYAQQNVGCLNFVRSASCASCKLGPRDQTNKVTAYLDGSTVYGSSPETLEYLRDNHDRAKLAVQQTGIGYLLPHNRNPIVDQCSDPHRHQICFGAGDVRSNQHPGLGILHTTFLRYHNQLVDIFRTINPHWDHETLFQEARRVIGAQIQFITYREYIHLVIGPTMMTFFDLWTLKSGYTFYAEALNAGIFNEIAAAAYRYGHSLIHTDWWRVNTTSGEVMSSLDLKDIYFNSDYLYGQPYDEFILGMITQKAMKFDRHVTPSVTQYLYKVKGQEWGYDLAAFNVYRGRDHGLQGYSRYLEFCYGVSIKTFQDLQPFMDKESIDSLMRIYKHVSDIDLWTGGLHERRLRDAVVGPTFGCLIGLQYYYLKFGDRFFFEHGSLPSSFNENQLREIRKTWFSYIMCKTGDNIQWSTLDVFQPPSQYNPILPCSQIPQIDWSAWAEAPPAHFQEATRVDE